MVIRSEKNAQYAPIGGSPNFGLVVLVISDPRSASSSTHVFMPVRIRTYTWMPFCYPLITLCQGIFYTDGKNCNCSGSFLLSSRMRPVLVRHHFEIQQNGGVLWRTRWRLVRRERSEASLCIDDGHSSSYDPLLTRVALCNLANWLSRSTRWRQHWTERCALQQCILLPYMGMRSEMTTVVRKIDGDQSLFLLLLVEGLRIQRRVDQTMSLDFPS